MARYIVTRTDGKPIPEDEPCFVIRAQDAFAPAMMTFYMMLAKDAMPAEKWNELIAHKNRLVAWQRVNRPRVKMPD